VPHSTVVVALDLVNLPQFKRLVRFAEDVGDYARLTADDELGEKVDELRLDLLTLTAERSSGSSS
jgi:hypothetical protein